MQGHEANRQGNASFGLRCWQGTTPPIKTHALRKSGGDEQTTTAHGGFQGKGNPDPWATLAGRRMDVAKGR